MRRKPNDFPPDVDRLLREMGNNIRQARIRRDISQESMAKRAVMSRTTLSAIENGEAGVALVAYVKVLQCLGLHEDLCLIAASDEEGRKLEDTKLPVHRRAGRPKAKKAESEN